MWIRRVVGTVLGFVVRAWVWTLRRDVLVPEEFSGADTRVFGFFHGQQMALLGAPSDRGRAVMVSHSRDGELQSSVMRALGLRVVRGSSSRGGAGGLRGLLRSLREGYDAAVAVDGPRGPRGVAKAGAALAAAASGALLFPVASAGERVWVLRSAWDRFEIPRPFSRVAIVVGQPISPDVVREHPEVLAASIARSRGAAEGLLRAGRSGTRLLEERVP